MRKFSLLISIALGLMFSNSASADYASTVLADGPIAYYTLNEVEGGEDSPADNLGSLGDEADGVFFGEEFEADPGPGLPGFGADNKAIRLTRLNETGEATPFGEASGVEVETPILDDLRAFTLSGWINPAEADLSNRAGLFGQDNAIEYGFIGANNMHFWAELPDGGDVHTNNFYDFDNDEWHHIAITADGETGDIFQYIDGEEQDFTQNNSMPLDDLGKDSYGISGNPFYIGGGPIFGADRQYAGAIDEVAVFDKFLTQEQIQAHYQAGITGGDPCDVNGDGTVDAADIDATAAAARDAGEDAAAAVAAFVKGEECLHTWIGDANLDGEFSSTDFVTVFQAGLFETGNPASWGQGDWNGDGVFSSGDFVAAFQDGGFELGPRWAEGVSAVPEPSAIVFVLMGLLAFSRRRR